MIQLQPTKDNPFTVEEAAQSGYVFSIPGIGNFLSIKSYNEQGQVIINDGCDDLHFSVNYVELQTFGEIVATKPKKCEEVEQAKSVIVPNHTRKQLEPKKLSELKAIASQLSITPKGDKRIAANWVDAILSNQAQKVEQPAAPKPLVEMSGSDCIVGGEIVATITSDNDLTQPWLVLINGVEVHRAATWARAYDYVRTHVKYGTLPNPQTEQVDDYLFHDDPRPVVLPVVGDSHFIGDRLLRCVEVGGEYAAVWEVIDNGVPIGEISMEWNCFWTHTLSLSTFATPQEATASLCYSLKVFGQERLMNIPQYEIYEYQENCCNVAIKAPDFLPQYITLDGKRFCYLDNPGDIWVEDEEFCRIVNSHNNYMAFFLPENRIWKVYDAISKEMVIKEIAFIVAQFLPYDQSSIVRWISENNGSFKVLWSQVKEASLPRRSIYGMSSFRSKTDEPVFHEINIDEWKKLATKKSCAT